MSPNRAYRRMMALMTKAGITNREDRLYTARHILDEPLESFTHMTDDQVEKVTAGLRSWEMIQEERFCNGTLFLEAGMIMEFLSDNGKLTLSEKSLLPDSTSRKAFMSEHPHLDVDEQRYSASTTDFNSVLKQITSNFDNSEPTRLRTSMGRWEPWRITPSPVSSIGLSLGIGGIPRGKIIHLWGKKHAGKSMLANCLIAEAQAAGQPCVLLDVEAASDGKFLRQLGVDVENLDVIHPPDLETLSMLLRSLADTGAFIVVDSIAAAESSHEADRNMQKDAAKMGGNARAWASTLALIRAKLLKNGGTLVLINQVRSKIGASQYEEPDKPYGSEAIQHNVDISIRVSSRKEKNATLKKDGFESSSLRFDKNRFAGNTQTITLSYRPGKPYNKSLDLVRFCSNPIHPGAEINYGEVAGNAILASTLADDNGGLTSRANRWTIRIDPTMMAAIQMDDPDFDEVSVAPNEAWDWDPEGSAPVRAPLMDEENSEYFTLPRVGEISAAKWLQAHPIARDVIIERMYDGLQKRAEILEGLEL